MAAKKQAKKTLDGILPSDRYFALLYEPDDVKNWMEDDEILMHGNPLALDGIGGVHHLGRGAAEGTFREVGVVELPAVGAYVFIQHGYGSSVERAYFQKAHLAVFAFSIPYHSIFFQIKQYLIAFFFVLV